jgi:hypothetical protein
VGLGVWLGALGAKCSASPACVAFNTGGLFKYASAPLTPWPVNAHGHGDPCTGTYLRVL